MPAGRFVEALKKCLRARGITYAALGRELRISEASVKRMFSRSSFTLSRIEEILAALDLDLHEVARMSLASAAGPTELTLVFARLDRLRLIEWGKEERARLRVAKDFQWRAGGPVKKAYGRRVIGEFLEARFDSPLELLRFETRQLSPESAVLLKRRLERLVAEFNDFAELDSAAPRSWARTRSSGSCGRIPSRAARYGLPPREPRAVRVAPSR